MFPLVLYCCGGLLMRAVIGHDSGCDLHSTQSVDDGACVAAVD